MPELTSMNNGLLWLGASILLAVLWTNLVPLIKALQTKPTSQEDETWHLPTWLLQVLRLIYYIGLPFAALLWGKDTIIARYIGLPGGTYTLASPDQAWADWAQDAGWAAAIGMITWLLLAIGWWRQCRALAIIGEPVPSTPTQPWWAQLREAMYHEVHWAFYRNVSIALWQESWGAWAGLVVVALEAALNPAWRAALQDPEQAIPPLTRAAIAIASTALFLQTQNLLLAIIAHIAIAWGNQAIVHLLAKRYNTTQSDHTEPITVA